MDTLSPYFFIIYNLYRHNYIIELEVEKMNSKKYYLSKCLILFLILSACIATTSAEPLTLTVGEGKDHLNISDALSNANNGSIILVSDGIYTEEDLVIDKRITLISENGSQTTTIKANPDSDTLITITVNNVTINGFTIEGDLETFEDGLLGRNGISLESVSSITITNNEIFGFYDALVTDQSGNNFIANNTFLNNSMGVFFDCSMNNTMLNNTFESHLTTFGVDGPALENFVHVVENNTIENKTIYYWVDMADAKIPSDAGQVYVINSTNITVKDLVLTHGYDGVAFVETDNSRIENVTTFSSSYGISLIGSNNNTLSDNIILQCDYDGVYVVESHNSILSNNIILLCGDEGIYIGRSDNATLSSNTVVLSNDNGIFIDESNDSTLNENTIAACNHNGIRIDHSQNNSLTNNIVTYGGLDSEHIETAGILLSGSDNNTLINNSADSNLGTGIAVVSSDNNILRRNTANENSLGGIWIASSDNNTLTDNLATDNYYGDLLSLGVNIDTALFGDDSHIDSSITNILANKYANDNSLDNLFSEAINSYPATFENTLHSRTAASRKNPVREDVGLQSVSINGGARIILPGSGIFVVEGENNTLTRNMAFNNQYDFCSALSYNLEVEKLMLIKDQAQMSFTVDEGIVLLSGNESSDVSLPGKTNVNGYIDMLAVIDPDIGYSSVDAEINIVLPTKLEFKFLYDDSGMSSNGESSIRLYQLNGTKWTSIPNSSLNTNANYVAAALDWQYITEYDSLDIGINSPTPYYGMVTLALFKDPEPPRSSGSLPQSLKDSTKTDLPITNDGEITKDTVVKSKNSDATLTLYKGTKAIDVSGNPVNIIRVTPFSYGPAGIPADATDHGLYFKFEPSGTTFSQDVMITMEFNPEDFEGRTPVIYTYTSEDGWIALETTVDWENGRATAMISHFSFYALFGTDAEPVKEASFEPTSETIETVTSEGNSAEESTDEKGLGFISWVVAIVLVIGLGIVYGTKKKKDGGL